MDARQQCAPQVPRPSYSQMSQPSSSSTTSSVFQSSSSLASLSSINTASATSQVARMQTGSAPLPSPSTSQPHSNYFGSMQPPASYSAQQQQRTPQPQLQQQQQPRQLPAQFVGQRGDGGGTPETAPFLQDFSLVAEAAKRAQMACLSRDLGDFGL